MANHKSAIKSVRQDAKRRERNRAVKGRVRTLVKAANAAIEGEGDAQAEVRSAERGLRKAASKGVIPKRRASRLASRLAKRAARS